MLSTLSRALGLSRNADKWDAPQHWTNQHEAYLDAVNRRKVKRDELRRIINETRMYL